MRRSLPVACLVLLAADAACADEVRVLAAASLSRPFHEAQTGFGERYQLELSFSGSQQLALQISQGARADVFASADERWIDDVASKGLIAGPPRVFARNRLVVITPAANPGRIDRPADLARAGLKLVLAADAVPAGRYSRQALAKLGSDAALGSDFAARVLANVVSEEESVQGVVMKVQLGEADAGIAYTSDVAPDLRDEVRSIEIPAAANVEARYFIGILKEAANPSGAAAFVAWLLSPAGQTLLVQHGFLPAAPA